MQFQITAIEFAFDDGIGVFPIENQQEIVDDHIGMIVEADDEDDLIEVITSTACWWINSVDYRIVRR